MDNPGDNPMTIDDILTFLQDFPDCDQITKNDLKNPTTELVQKLYFKILIEMGLCESGLIGNQADFETLTEFGEEMDLFKQMLPIMSLQSAIVNILTRICGTTNFGLNDITNPDSKRTLLFLGRLLNFYTFCNGEYGKVEEVQTLIDACIRERDEKIAKIEKLRIQNNIEAGNACEEKNILASTMEENEILDGRMKDLLVKQNSLLETKEGFKKELEVTCQQIQDIEKEVHQMEKEKDSLQGAIEGAAVIAKLEEEITVKNEEMEMRRRKIVDTKKRIDQVENSNLVLKSILEVGKQYASEKSNQKSLVSKIQELNGKIASLHAENDERSSLVRDEETRLREKSDALGKLKAQWSRRRQGKEEDLRRVDSEFDEAKSVLSDEQEKALRMKGEISRVEIERSSVQENMVTEADHIRRQYTILLETIENFNAKLTNNFAKLG